MSLDANWFIPVLPDPDRSRASVVTGETLLTFSEPINPLMWTLSVFPQPDRTREPIPAQNVFELENPPISWRPVLAEPDRTRSAVLTDGFVKNLNIPWERPPSETFPDFILPAPRVPESCFAAPTLTLWERPPAVVFPDLLLPAPRVPESEFAAPVLPPPIPEQFYPVYPDYIDTTPHTQPGGWVGPIEPPFVPDPFWPSYPDQVPGLIPPPWAPIPPIFPTPAGPILATLVERTPYRLRYLLTSSGDGQAVGILPNAGGATPDLHTDAAFFGGLPIDVIMRKLVANQADARRLLFGDGLVARLDLERVRCVVTLWARSSVDVSSIWSVDANEGAAAGSPASAGHAVLSFSGPAGQLAYVEIVFQDGYDR